MPGQSDTPRTPTSTSAKTGKITDFFKSVHQSEPKQVAKRELDVEDHEDSQPSKRLKQSEDGHAGRIGTAHHKVDIDIDTPKRKKPASARLLDDTDGGLADSFVGRRRFTKETNAEDVKPIQDAHLKSTRPLRTADRTNQSGRKRPTSSRLLDETDGGLEESLASPSEIRRDEKDFVIFKDPEENQKVDSKDDTVNDSTMGNNAVGNNISDDDSEASTIRAWDSEDEMSSSGDVDGEGDEALDFDIFEDEEEREDDESGNGAMDDKSLRDITDEFDTVEDDSETETIKADNSDDDDDKDGSIDKDDKEDDDGSDKENVRPRVPYKAPSLPLIPSNPEHHGNQEDETADPTENDQPSPSPSSFMLPSPVADLPPVPPPSPTSPSTLPPDFSSTLLSHPSSQ